MVSSTRARIAIPNLVLMSLLVACSGGDVGTTSVSSTGVITGFSSIFVNGAKYEVEDGTVVSVEGESERFGDDSALRIGMKVQVEASERGGRRVADRIEFDEDLRGPARDVMPDPFDPSLGTFTVIGQFVTVDANTIFDDDLGNNDGQAGIDVRDIEPALFPGSVPIVVEVSGFPTEDGWLATRIDRVNTAAGDIGRTGVDDDELELKGFVASVAGDGSSIVVGGVTFEVDDDTIFEDGLVADAALVGRFVEVKADLLAGGDLLAVRVEREDDFDRDDRREFEIEGILQSVELAVDPDEVAIDGRTIQVSDASGLADMVGSRIEIKGTFDADGVLVIGRSKLEAENSVRTEDRVAEIDRVAGTFTTRLGIVIRPEGTSRLEDDASEDDQGDRLTPPQFLERIEQGDSIEARGVPGGDGNVAWTRIERDDDDDIDCRLRGPVESITGDAGSFEFVILGVTVDTDGVDSDDFEDAGGNSIGRSAFFDALSVGDVVQGTSFESNSSCQNERLEAREIEFEPDDGVMGSGSSDDSGSGQGSDDD